MKVGSQTNAAALSGTLGESKPLASKVGEIDDQDLYVPGTKDQQRSKASHFKDVCEQLLADHVNRPKTRMALQIVARILGLSVARCLSNIISFFTGSDLLGARRDYGLLPPHSVLLNAKDEPLKLNGQDMTAKMLAERFKPHIYTISEDQATDDSVRPAEIRYEVLPPDSQGKDTYALIYYVRRESERLPIPLIGTIWELIRPLLYGTKSEWNAIEIDIDRETGTPLSIAYESSNYTSDPLSYEMTGNNDVHLPAKVVLKDNKWTHTVNQKDGKGKSHVIENPFEKDTHPSFSFVNWDGDLDLVNAAKLLGYESQESATNKRTLLYDMKDLPLSFLDIDTYRSQALDLRNLWLKRRQTGHCHLYFPPRKDASQFRVINLVKDQLPSLIAR